MHGSACHAWSVVIYSIEINIVGFLMSSFSKKIPRTLIVLVSIITFPLSYIYSPFAGDVSAATTVTLSPTADAFVRENSPDRNYGSWNDMTVGRSWNLGNYFSNSFAYILFSLPGLNAQSIIHSATLDVYQYVRSDYASGNYNVRIANARSSWSEMGITWNNKPDFSGVYAEQSIDGFGGQWFNPPKKYSFDVTSLVEEWAQNGNHGLVMYKDSGNYGGFWCSRNYNNATCFASSVPKLKITYSQNTSPHIPDPSSPDNLAEFGGDATGQGVSVTMKVSDLGDDEENLDGTWFYYKRVQDGQWEQSPKRTGKKTAQFTKHLPDGVWQWRARSLDAMGLWSGYSPVQTFTVDTTPPSQSIPETEPLYSMGNQNTITVSESVDEIIGNVSYMFDVKIGAQCSTDFFRSMWQESTDFSIVDLEHNRMYCYRVRSRDRLGNVTAWSDFVMSTQDAVLPEISNARISDEVFSPNGDNNYDKTMFTFEIVEEHFQKWDIAIRNSLDEVVKRFSGEVTEQTVEWFGRDDTGIVVADGPYTFEITASDLAGNKTIDSSQTVIVDNTVATLNISQPLDGSWFNAPEITIAGITEPNSFLSVNGVPYDVSAEGIFEGTELIIPGENVFEIIATDAVANISSRMLSIRRENVFPEIRFISPDSLINTEKPIVTMELFDAESGIDEQAMYMTILHDSGSELVLVNEGQNVQPELGRIVTNCSSTATGGSSRCEYSYIFDHPLQPDGGYQIQATVTDVAGNISEMLSQPFELDTHTYLEVKQPVEGVLFNKSTVTIKGRAERDAMLNVKTNNSKDTLVIDPTYDEVSNCEQVDGSFGTGWQGIGEVCDFEIIDFQLEADFDNDVEIVNRVTIELTDAAGNMVVQNRTISVNLFAVELSIEGNFDFISPNGDGRQDGIDFKMIAVNRTTGDSDVDVGEWEIRIKDNSGSPVSLLYGVDAFPPNYYFDGTTTDGDWLGEGVYSYTLWLRTTDGVVFETLPQTFTVKTDVSGEVIITNPKNGTVTTRGVMNVQGQAPLDTVVTVCVDMIGIDGDCNDEQIVDVNEQGFFTSIVPLATKESLIWAVATDEAGNQTPRSNSVRVKLDVSAPLLGIYALPTLVGIDQEVLLRSIVTENTSNVRMKFTDYTDLSELPEGEVDWYLVGEVGNEHSEVCNTSECVWDYHWTTPEVTGGVYEIAFTAKKGESYQTKSLGIRIDGTIPIVPTILHLKNQSTNEELRFFQDAFYSNHSDIDVFGVAEPLTNVHILLDNVELATVKTNATGRWSARIALPQSAQEAFTVTAVSSDNVNNQSDISVPVMVVLDRVAPQFEDVLTSNVYHHSGTVADVLVHSNESLFQAQLQRQDLASFDLAVRDSYRDYAGSFSIESDAPEGEYNAKISIEDYAGNVSETQQQYIIDDTPPEATAVDTGLWGKWNGVEAKIDIPAIGRLVPQYVIRGRDLRVDGMAEQFSEVEIWLDSYKIDVVEVGDHNCSGETRAYPGKNFPLCEWTYDLNLGAYEKGYILQTKVVDRAHNKSGVSDSLLVFYDATSPRKPEALESKSYWNADGLGNITNHSEITLNFGGEKLSDVEVWVRKASYKKYYKYKVSSHGEWNGRIRLGGKHGGGEDGIYSVFVQSTDAAGNRSEKLAFTIERDTVAPQEPFVGDPYLCGNAICVKIRGEDGTAIYANDRYIGNARSSESTFTLTGKWLYGTSYTYSVYLQDRARNKSIAVVKQIRTARPPLGDTDVQGVKDGDHWGTNRGDNLRPIQMDVTIDPYGGYTVAHYNIPRPILTDVVTKLDDTVEIYGAGVPKHHPLEVHIRRTFMTYAEAKSACGVGLVFSARGKLCMEEKMGIDSVNSWRRSISLKCVFNPLCVADRERRERIESDRGVRRFRAEHVQIQLRDHTRHERYLGDLWNDASDGRFHKIVKLGIDIRVDDLLQAKTTIYGDFEVDGVRIDYRGTSDVNAGNNAGLSSGWSNGMKIPGKPHIFSGAINPLSDGSCDGYIITSPFGERRDPFSGKIKFHSGIDIAKYGGCNILAAYEGTARTTWYAGDTIIITHNDMYETRYGHAAHFNGKYPRLVFTGEEIMYMGKSGKATGVHIHFEVWENGTFVDPTKYFNF